MFNIFNKKTPETPPVVSGSDMSEERAQTIVYAFIDRMAEGAPLVGDAETLPYPKETIRAAFIMHLDHYEEMRKISEEVFRRNGYDETVEQLRGMSMRLNDWHIIDPEDKDAVARMNSLAGPPEAWAVPIMGKYMRRSLEG
ncbi:hypothetical protein V2O64_16030 [Verrucomicrobiaceae bacterium 227]